MTMENRQKHTKLTESQYSKLLNAVMASETGPNLSNEQVLEMLNFYESAYPKIKEHVVKLLDYIRYISVEDIFKNDGEALDKIDVQFGKIENIIEQTIRDVMNLDSYISAEGPSEYEDQSNNLYDKYNTLGQSTDAAMMIAAGLRDILNKINDNEYDFSFPEEPDAINIDEKFASKAQQGYFYSKANDTSLPKAEREKWKSMAGEFASKTDFSHLPEKK